MAAPVATIAGIGSHAGQVVTLRGWLRGKRSSGKLLFLQVRDGTGTIQCTLFRPDVAEELFERAGHLPQESSLIVHGEVRPDPRAPGGYEVGVRDLEVVAVAAGEFPISPKGHGPAFLLHH